MVCDYVDIVYDGIICKSGEFYILYLIVVSCILVYMCLDVEILMVVFLYDVIEDIDFSKEDIVEKFGKIVVELVDGVIKFS